MTNFTSFTPFRYKIGLIKALIDRTFKISSSWLTFHQDLCKVKHTLLKNCFPINLFNKTVKSYLNSKFSDNQQTKSDSNPRFFKLPFVGMYSCYAQKRITNVIKRLCKPDVAVRLVFTPLKIASIFSMKDKVPETLRSFVVYKFDCAGCNACYVGETSRHLSTRIKEHLNSDKLSHIYKHLNTNAACKVQCNETCFSVLDSANTKYGLKIKEGLQIKWIKPNLNKQVKCLTTTLCI